MSAVWAWIGDHCPTPKERSTVLDRNDMESELSFLPAKAVPGVRDVEIAVFALDDGWVRVFSGPVFEGGEDPEVLAIAADSQVQRSTRKSTQSGSLNKYATRPGVASALISHQMIVSRAGFRQ